MKSDLLACLRVRARLLAAIRAHFDRAGFLEVTTPSLVTAPDPAVHLESFRTTLDLDDGSWDLFLTTSPELHMKRMLAAGLGSIYQLCPFFRNGELGPLHNPEFTGLEWYEASATLERTMDRTEALVREVAREVTGGTFFERCGAAVDLDSPFRRMTVRRALSDLAGVDVPAEWSETGLREALSAAGLPPAKDDRFDDLVNRALVARVEPALAEMGPVFLIDYPAPMAALARLKTGDPAVAERFELYAGGLELCNGYGELTDPKEQRRRFEAQIQERERTGKPAPPLDEHFLDALEQGMPAAGGNALGVDRLLMLLCERERIDQVLAFPLAGELATRSDRASWPTVSTAVP